MQIKIIVNHEFMVCVSLSNFQKRVNNSSIPIVYYWKW